MEGGMIGRRGEEDLVGMTSLLEECAGFFGELWRLVGGDWEEMMRRGEVSLDLPCFLCCWRVWKMEIGLEVDFLGGKVENDILGNYNLSERRRFVCLICINIILWILNNSSYIYLDAINHQTSIS
jgi:hypothetical protein